MSIVKVKVKILMALETCCGCYSLRDGVWIIGVYDCLNFLLDLIWVIIAGAGSYVFLISTKN